MKCCARCKLEFTEDAEFCSLCGNRLGIPTPARGKTPADADNEQLLADANVLRLRKEWRAAVEKCTQALELDPRDPEAHSLLGRIYEDKGDIDEAIRWLQMAVDLSPSSRPDQEALDVLLNKQAKIRAARAADARSEDESWYDSLWKSPKFRSLVGYAILAFFAAALTFIAGSLLFLLTKERGFVPPQPEIRQPSPRAAIEQTPAPAPSAPVESVPEVRSAAEQQLLAQIRGYGLLTQRGIGVESIILDPRKRSATATFRLQKVNPSQSEVLAEALVLSSVLFVARQEINDLTVRAIASLPDEFGGQQWTLAFVGDTTRARATAIDMSKATPDQIRAVFTASYFHGEGGKAQ